MTGQLYRGSKPVMWSVVEKTALAEAEVEYQDHTSDTVWVAFPVIAGARRADLAEARRRDLDDHALDHPRQPGDRLLQPHRLRPLPRHRGAGEQLGQGRATTYVLADKLADEVFKAAKVEAFERLRDVIADELAEPSARHPLAGVIGYGFDVPLLDGDHVTDEAGTGFVHTAPGHGREDFDVWMANARPRCEARGIDTHIPYTVDGDGFFTAEAPGFGGPAVITDKGDKGDANDAVIEALIEAGNLVARGRLKHQYPHSWRSKKPVIFRNTPQWFIRMDKPWRSRAEGRTLRETARRCARARCTPSARPNGCRRRARTASPA